VRKGGVAVFPAMDSHTGTERLVVLAEVRTTDAEERRQITESITQLAVDQLGMPPDDVVLAPPRSVLKTSSGKIRRATCRELLRTRCAQPHAAPALVAACAFHCACRGGQVRRATWGGVHVAWAKSIVVIQAPSPAMRRSTTPSKPTPRGRPPQVARRNLRRRGTRNETTSCHQGGRCVRLSATLFV